MIPTPFVVTANTREAEDVVTLTVAQRDNSEIPSFTPGQFSMLYAFGIGEIAIGISSDPSDLTQQMYTIRPVGSVSKALSLLSEEDQLGIRGPFGNGWPIAESQGKDIVIVAGGLGLTSLRAALFSIIKDRQNYGKVILLFGSRSPESIIYQNDFEVWLEREDLTVTTSVDFAPGGYSSHVGVVTTLIPKAEFDRNNVTTLICGPEVMIRYSIESLKAEGVAESSIFLSMERNMKCAIGHCGRCQFGNSFVCKDGPVLRYDKIKHFFNIREV